MKLYISAANKLLFVILTILMVMVAAYSVFSFGRLERDFEYHRYDVLKYAEKQLNQQVGQLTSQLTAWLESFSGMNELQYQNDFEEFSNELHKQHHRLQLYFNVIDIWLIDNEEVLLSTSPLNDVVLNNSNDVLNNQLPIEKINCEDVCVHLISLPILNNGNIAVVTFTVSMVDMLYSLNAEEERDLAVVRIPKNINHDEITHVISISNTDLIPSLKETESFDYTGDKINSFTLNETNYSVDFLYLDETQDYRYSLAVIEDVTAILDDSIRHRIEFILVVAAVFICVAILIYLVFKPFTRKLLKLSNALPMLSNKEFTEFRRIQLSSNAFFNDEFDILATSTTDLSIQLEKLNKEVEQKTYDLEKMAMQDSLTGLPNRHMLNRQLNKSRYQQSQNNIAVLFLDLDDFKKVNDSHGHGQGDQLLIEAAKRLQMSVRASDIVYRFGGDEFVIILHDIEQLDDVKNIADKIIDKFSEPIVLSQSLFYVSTSIGIVMSEDKAIDADALISYADIAMYEAKACGGSTYHIYHDDMYQRVSNHVYMENEVRQALLKQQFSLCLQPQIIAKDYKLYGFEALLRWNHPEKGFISPDEFIPILENSYQIIDVGYWVMRRCFELTKRFIRIGYHDICIAINLSAEQFADPNLQIHLEGLLIEFDIAPEHFELELTEQTLVKDISHTISVMNNLKDLGFSFAIDDFGTGYSSLSYLRKMPVDVIKIDKSFVAGMIENKADHQIILSTIAMVKSLELNIVAEGVETHEQLEVLTQNNCDIIQGYYFSTPIPEHELFDTLKSHVNNGIWQL